MKTPHQLEQELTRAFRKVAADLDTLTPDQIADRMTGARTDWLRYRRRHGFTSPAPILTEDIGKTLKNPTRTYALALMPHTRSKVANLCPFEDQCATTCVAFSGKGTLSTVAKSRTIRTTFMVNHPEQFAWIMFAELDHATNTTDRVAVRLNAFSDLRWEKIAPSIFTRYPRIRFYDYTKHPIRSRPAHTIPPNYRLTFSVSPRTTLATTTATIAAGRNVAVVFPTRAHSLDDTLPKKWVGARVIDGDKTDERFSDPLGVVVGLRRKGSLKATDPLATVAEQLDNQHRKASV